MGGEFIQGLRQKVGPALLPLCYATAIIRDARGVLFQRRADFGSAWWGLPGGLIEPGESPAACLRREVLEETGLRVRPVLLGGLYSSLRYQVEYPNGHQVQQVTLVYLAEIEGGTLRPAAGEIEALAWFEAQALPPMPRWYADMLNRNSWTHAWGPEAYFDPPEAETPATPLATLAAVQAAAGGAEALPWPVGAMRVMDAQERVLLRRNAAGEWDLPATPMRAGETLAYTAQRALRAQTGLDLRPDTLLTAAGGHRAAARAGHQAYYPVTALFAAALNGPPPDLPATARFFERGAMPPMPAATAELVRRLWDGAGAAH